MKKNAVIVTVVVILVVLLGGYFFMKKVPHKALTTSNSTTTQDSSPKSLRDLLMSTVAEKCTFSEGVTYIAAGKVRGDFTKSHMIVDGKTSYIWTDGSTIGFKATIPDETALTSATPSSTTANLDQKADYKCQAWNVDQSLFVLPVGVTFRDMSAVVPPVAAPNNSQCSYCDSLTGNSKTQCLAALKCN